ncbi:MAG TPA: alpha/beta hydrolase-fold protein [Acidimicrobiales bacterium]|nr:alpha/beta hydrolase-fold protein [Acidimicrobiales bacterium]
MTNDESPLADTEVHYLSSLSVGEDFKLFIGHCGDSSEPADAVPTLYLTDANGFFGLAVDIVRSMQLAAHLPPMLVVGIGYRTGTLDQTIVARARDLTPSNDAKFTKLYPDQSNLGGASSFLEFLGNELIPWVAARFPVHPRERAFFGHSLGGLFGTYTLLRAGDTFTRYIISSPSLWWHDHIIRSVERSYAASHDDLCARVFFGIGSEETHDGRRREAANQPEDAQRIATAWYIDMVDDLRRFVDQLKQRRYPSLHLTSAVFPDEFHITVPQLTLSRGLRTLFDTPR